MGQKHSSSSVTLPSPFKMGSRHNVLVSRQNEHGPTDLVLVVRGHRFPVHRHVLIQHSGYFQSMLTHFVEREMKEVELFDEVIEPDVMSRVMECIYSQAESDIVTPSNVHDLLLAATYFQMDWLQSICCSRICDKIDKRNAVTLYLRSVDLGPYELQCRTQAFILSHFDKVFKHSKDFHRLTKEQLISFISHDKLLVSSETAVYKAVLKWVSADLKWRSQDLSILLQHVHFPLMSRDEVDQSLKDSMVKRNKNLVSVLVEARNYMDKNTQDKISYWTGKHKPIRWPKILIVLRMYWKNLPMEYYDFKTKEWHEMGPVQSWRSCTSLASHGTKLFLIGGEETDANSPTGSRTVNRVTKYDCEQQAWSSAPSMILARRWAAAIVLNDHIYVIGGIGGRGGTYEKRLNSMECLDLLDKQHKWHMLTSMSTPRSSHTVECLEGKIYVVGGGDGREWLNSAEVFDPKKNQWSPIANLNIKRWKCGLVALGGFLYAIGGMDSPQAGSWGSPLNSVERYSPTEDCWTEVTPMTDSRFGCAVVAHHGKIYVSGGFGSDKNILSSAECFDPETMKWSKLSSMKNMSGFIGGILVDRPIHLQDTDT